MHQEIWRTYEEQADPTRMSDQDKAYDLEGLMSLLGEPEVAWVRIGLRNGDTVLYEKHEVEGTIPNGETQFDNDRFPVGIDMEVVREEVGLDKGVTEGEYGTFHEGPRGNVDSRAEH